MFFDARVVAILSMTGKVPDLLAEIALCFVDLICHAVIVWWLKTYTY